MIQKDTYLNHNKQLVLCCTNFSTKVLVLQSLFCRIKLKTCALKEVIFLTYSFTCDQGHEPETFTVEAENDDEAVTKIMEAASGHLAEKHPEMSTMTPEEGANLIRSRMTQV